MKLRDMCAWVRAECVTCVCVCVCACVRVYVCVCVFEEIHKQLLLGKSLRCFLLLVNSFTSFTALPSFCVLLAPRPRGFFFFVTRRGISFLYGNSMPCL